MTAGGSFRKGTLAAARVGMPWMFVTSKRSDPPGHHVQVEVIPGTGVIVRGLIYPNFNGVGGSFPFGYDVVPDRPRFWSV